MTRPRVTIYNATSLDGRITGFPIDVGLFYEIAGGLAQQAILSGSSTLLASAAQYGVDLSAEEPDVPDPPGGDGPWLVVVDAAGRLTRFGWLLQQPHWRGVIVLCAQATPREQLDRLRRLGIPHHAVGGEHVDLSAALHLLAEQYQVRDVRVDAGGTLNGVLLAEGLADEVCVLLSPYLGGSQAVPSRLVDGLPEGFAARRLTLAGSQALREDHLLLRYRMPASARASS
jgi:2,5-diamino-6-(ribosylamino)-4(3H)-pyrimidinone 5'-phosphate reductase